MRAWLVEKRNFIYAAIGVCALIGFVVAGAIGIKSETAKARLEQLDAKIAGEVKQEVIAFYSNQTTFSNDNIDFALLKGLEMGTWWFLQNCRVLQIGI